MNIPNPLRFTGNGLKKSILALMAGVGIMVPVAHGQLTMALTGEPTAQGLANWGAGEVDGFLFRTPAVGPVTVRWLGFYDKDLDGLASEHNVRIWKASGGYPIVASAVIPAGTVDSLEGNFRGHNITPVILEPNTEYVIADACSDDDLRQGNDLAGWVINGITILGGRYGYPTPTEGYDTMIGASFGYTQDLSILLDSPAANQAYVTGTSITASATIFEPNSALTDTVTFHMTPTDPAGSTVTIISTDTASPYTADFGVLPDGTYEMFATVTNDDVSPGTDTSATHTFTIAPSTPSTINVDFGSGDTYTGVGVAPDTGTTWNPLGASATNVALLNSMGAASGVSLTLGTNQYAYNAGPASDLLEDYVFNINDTSTVTLSGLTPNSAFSLYLYGNGDNTTQSSTFTLSSANGGATGSTVGSDRTNISATYVKLNGTVDSLGKVIFTWTAAAGTSPYGPFNGFQLDLNPVADIIPPTLTSIEHNKGAGPVAINEPVTYTVTFSEAMAPATVNAADFGNAGTAPPLAVDSVTPTANPAVFQVGVTPTGTGTLQLQINAGATLTDLAGLPLDATNAIPDDIADILLVEDIPPTPTSITVVTSGSPTTYGENVTFTATVDPIPSGGTVQFLDGFNYLGDPVPVNTSTGEATYSTTTLAAGTYSITAEYSGNYAFEPSTSSSISQEVGQAILTVTAQDTIRTTNTANPDPLPYQITGYQNGEDLATSGVTGTPLLTTTATLVSSVGDYPITCALGSLAAANYSFTLVDGTLTVTNLACQVGVLNLNANGGINPATGNPWAAGDKYRLIFVTSGNVDCSSTDITTYNTAVQNLANASTTFPSLGSVTWKVVGSTASVAARDNTNTNPGVDGTGEPIVRMDGTFVIANNYADLWNGIVASHVTGQNYLAVHLDENGVETIEERVRTGSNANGTASATQMLGAVGEVQTGRNFTPDFYNGYGGSGWMTDWQASGDGRVYAISAPLTIQTIAPGNTFTDWADANAPGQTAGQDHDDDGVDNGIEYFMGESGSSFTAMPGLDGTNMITWTMDADYQGTYEVQTSPDLVEWTNVDPRPVAVDGNLSYTLPPGLGKRFVRLLVTPTP